MQGFFETRPKRKVPPYLDSSVHVPSLYSPIELAGLYGFYEGGQQDHTPALAARNLEVPSACLTAEKRNGEDDDDDDERMTRETGGSSCRTLPVPGAEDIRPPSFAETKEKVRRCM